MLARGQRRFGLELLRDGAVLSAVATFPMWWGGFSAPARFLGLHASSRHSIRGVVRDAPDRNGPMLGLGCAPSERERRRRDLLHRIESHAVPTPATEPHSWLLRSRPSSISRRLSQACFSIRQNGDAWNVAVWSLGIAVAPCSRAARSNVVAGQGNCWHTIVGVHWQAGPWPQRGSSGASMARPSSPLKRRVSRCSNTTAPTAHSLASPTLPSGAFRRRTCRPALRLRIGCTRSHFRTCQPEATRSRRRAHSPREFASATTVTCPH